MLDYSVTMNHCQYIVNLPYIINKDHSRYLNMQSIN